MPKKPSNLTPPLPSAAADARDPSLQRGPIGRRTFVKTTGGILAATGLAACSGTTDPSKTGSVVVTITGLGAGLVDGGTAVVTRTDIATQLPVTIPLPPSGSAQADVPAGTYNAVYTPPAGYQVTGTNVFVITVEPLKTTTVAVAVSFIVVATQGTLRVVVTGLTASAPDGGSAKLQIPGQAIITALVPLSGTIDTVVTAGAYSVTYTPPAGWSTVGGTVNPKSVTVNASATATATFAVIVTPVGFPTPDLLNNASFETDFDSFKNGSAGLPTGVTRDTAHAWASGNVDAPGQFSVKRVLPVTSGTDIVANLFWPFYAGPGVWNMPVPAQTLDRLWGRFYFYFDAVMTGTLKFQIYEGAGFNSQFGGFYCQNGKITWGWINEWQAISLPFVQLSTLLNGWHSLECDYWRNGDPSGFPSVAIWLDGNQITAGIGNPPSPGFWANGRLNAGERKSSLQIGTYNLAGVLNGTPANTVAANLWMDRVSISSVGRIGP